MIADKMLSAYTKTQDALRVLETALAQVKVAQDTLDAAQSAYLAAQTEFNLHVRQFCEEETRVSSLSTSR